MSVGAASSMRMAAGMALAVIPCMLILRPGGSAPAPQRQETRLRDDRGDEHGQPAGEADRCLGRVLHVFEEFKGRGASPAPADPALVHSGLGAHGASGHEQGHDREVQAIFEAVTDTLASMSRRPLAAVETIVATLPDPIDSGLAYAFDTNVQGLVRGMEYGLPSARTYYSDRAWLPWNDRAKDEASSDPDGCRSAYPGVLLLRSREPSQPGLAIVLVVGESPIAGVHMRAFARALQLSRLLESSKFGRLSALRPDEEEPGLRVLGPTFAGSAASMRRTIDAMPGIRVRFISGTASGPDVGRVLGAAQSRPNVVSVERPDTSYRATTLPEQALECSFLHYARRAGAARNPHVGSEASAVDGVAILRETGTEFGSSSAHRAPSRRDVGCDLVPEIHLSFPFHVSAVRDAYEDLDQQSEARKLDPTLARPTALDVSFRGAPRTDTVRPSSTTTKYAQDLALGRVLAEIDREGVRWLGIRATDVADAIFLARKVRDVAPDVRIAFFDADALLMHPAFHDLLLGSIVVTPYPFLGADHFRASAPVVPNRIVGHQHAAFPNAASEGVYNAVLALRGADVKDLMEYAFIRPSGPEDARDLQPLPVWIAALGRSGFVPLQARPALDCDHTIYGANHGASRLLCEASETVPRAWANFNRLRELELHLDPDVMPPRFSHLVLALLLLGALLHHVLLHARHQRELETMPYPRRDADDDALLDRCIVRTKWRLYAAYARATLWLAVLYMAVIYTVAAWVYFAHDHGPRLWIPLSIAAAASVGLFVWNLDDVRRLRSDIRAFRRVLVDRRIMHRHLPHRRLFGGRRGVRALWCGLEFVLGLAEPPRDSAQHPSLLYVSFAQIRTLFWLGTAAISVFGFAALAQIWLSTDAALDSGFLRPATTLFALRNVPLTNGVSTSAPILLSLGCVYIWATGRMQRLRLLHTLSECTDRDGLLDGVSTPIRSILYQGEDPDRGFQDEGFTEVERSLVNAVLRPSGRVYFAALAAIVVVPAILYLLLRPTTLETAGQTRVLFGVLGSCGILTCATLVQLLLYRRALARLLQRMMAHPLGASFRLVIAPVRESIDAQISHLADRVVRAAACEHAFQRLSRSSVGSFGEELAKEMKSLSQELMELREAALTAREPIHARVSGRNQNQAPAPRVVQLERALVRAARKTMELLSDHWRVFPATISWEISGPLPASSPSDKPSPAWVQDAESFVATVVALLLNRHVRQFRHFLGATTGCSLLLLLAVTSYPFQPQRVLMTGLWLLVLTVVLTCLFVFLSLDRAPILRFIAGEPEKAGQITFDMDLAKRVTLWVLLPILIVLATQYPEVAHELGRVLEPFAFSLK